MSALSSVCPTVDGMEKGLSGTAYLKRNIFTTVTLALHDQDYTETNLAMTRNHLVL